MGQSQIFHMSEEATLRLFEQLAEAATSVMLSHITEAQRLAHRFFTLGDPKKERIVNISMNDYFKIVYVWNLLSRSSNEFTYNPEFYALIDKYKSKMEIFSYAGKDHSMPLYVQFMLEHPWLSHFNHMTIGIAKEVVDKLAPDIVKDFSEPVNKAIKEGKLPALSKEQEKIIPFNRIDDPSLPNPCFLLDLWWKLDGVSYRSSLEAIGIAVEEPAAMVRNKLCEWIAPSLFIVFKRYCLAIKCIERVADSPNIDGIVNDITFCSIISMANRLEDEVGNDVVKFAESIMTGKFFECGEFGDFYQSTFNDVTATIYNFKKHKVKLTKKYAKARNKHNAAKAKIKKAKLMIVTAKLDKKNASKKAKSIKHALCIVELKI